MSWDKIACGFDVEEETRNFGTRQFGIGEEFVFESSTLAVIESSDEFLQRPHCISTNHSSGLAVALDSNIIIFTPDLSKLKFSVKLPRCIEAIEWSEDGTFLFLGLEQGVLIAIHIVTETLFKISSLLDASGASYHQKFFACVKSYGHDNILDVTVVTTARKIIRIYGACVKDVLKCCCDGVNQLALSNIISNRVKIDVTHPAIHCEYEAKVAENHFSDNLIIFHNDCIEQWSPVDGALCLINSAFLFEINCNEIIKASLTQDLSNILCLLKNGTLTYISVDTLEAFLFWENNFKDFSYTSKELLTVLENKDSSSFNISSYNLPDNSLYFCLQNVSNSLIPSGLNESIFYFEFIENEDSNTIKIKSINEGDPKLRLSRLLQRGKFDEAEKFCQCFNLPMTEIVKCRAQMVASDMSLWNHDTSNDNDYELFDRLVALLNDITDISFVVGVCTLTVPRQLELIKKLLEYATLRFQQLKPSERQQNITSIEKVTSLSTYYRTFMQIKTITHTPDLWSQYPSRNLFDDCKKYISEGDIKSAVILCQNHWPNISKGLTLESGLTLLTSLPCYITHDDLFLWLETYSSLFLSLHDDSGKVYCDWIYEIISVQLSFNKDVKACLYFIGKIHSLIQDIYKTFMCLRLYCASLINYLVDSKKVLSKLDLLKHDHNVMIPFEHLPTSKDKEKNKDFLFNVLGNVTYDGIEPLVHVFLIPYCSDNNFKSDEILSSFIRWQSRSIGDLKGVTEMKFIKLTDFICSETERMETLIFILNEASVPWNETICQLEKSLSDTLPVKFRDSLKFVKRVSTVKTLLVKYTNHQSMQISLFDDICLDNVVKVSTVIMELSGYDNPIDLFKDVQLLAGFVDCEFDKASIYSSYLWLSVGECCTEVALNTLTSGLDESLIKHTFTYCAEFLKLQLPFVLKFGITPSFKENLDYLITSVKFHSVGSNLPTKFSDIIASFKEKYGVDVTIEKMNKGRMMLAIECITALLKGAELGDDLHTSYFISEVRNISTTLEVPIWSICFVLVEKALNENKLDLAVEGIKVITVENADGCIPPYKVLNFIWMIIQNVLPQSNGCRRIYKTLKSLSKTVLHSSNFVCEPGLMSKMGICSIMFDLLERCEFKKRGWCAKTVYFDSYKLDISNCDYRNLISLLDRSFNKQNNEAISENFLSEFIGKLPFCLNSVLIACKLRTEFAAQHTLTDREGKKIKTIITHMISQILLKMVFSDSLALEQALSLVTYFPREHALKWIDNVSLKTETFRQYNLMQLARHYCFLFGLPVQLNEYNDSFMVSLWSRKYSKFGISFQDPYDDSNIRLTIQKLIKLPEFNVNELKHFCSAFNRDYQKCLLFYLSEVTLKWKLDLSVENDVLVIKNNHEELSNTIHSIANKLEDPSVMAKHIVANIWNKINPYYYEIFSILLNFICDTAALFDLSKVEENFHFLLTYKRISTPSKEEIDMWKHYLDLENQCNDISCSDMQLLSRYRFPFKPFSEDELWKFIRPELSLDNYTDWFQLKQWFMVPLEKEIICFYAIKNLKSSITNQQNWDLQLQKNDLLAKINECVGHITNCELATCTLYFIANSVIPPGADQVEAAQHCFFKAIDWIDQEKTEESKKWYNKAEKKYMTVKVRHILHKNHLDDFKFLKLISEPTELIKSLYELSTINDSNQSGINDAARAIAVEFENVFSLVEIKKELLFKWLSAPPIDENIEDNLNFQKDDEDNFDLVNKAFYMLRGEDKTVYCNVLLSVTQDEYRPTLMKLRALEILLSIVPKEELFRVTGKMPEQLLDHFKNLKHTYRLERVGLMYSINEFVSSPKEEILLSLLADCSPHKCVVAAKIADAYAVDSIQIWSSIIEKFTAFNMSDQLKQYLISKLNLCLVLDSNLHVKAWNTLIKSFILKGDRGTSKEELTEILSKCPILNQVNLTPSG